MTIGGSARSYDVASDGYRAWINSPVLLQRWTSSGWQTIRTLASDRNGNVNTSVRIPFTVGLRLVTPDSPTVWGASSAGLNI